MESGAHLDMYMLTYSSAIAALLSKSEIIL